MSSGAGFLHEIGTRTMTGSIFRWSLQNHNEGLKNDYRKRSFGIIYSKGS